MQCDVTNKDGGGYSQSMKTEVPRMSGWKGRCEQKQMSVGGR